MTSCPLCFGSTLIQRSSVQHKRYFECSTCGLISLDPAQQISSAEERARYEKHNNSASDPGYREHLNKVVIPLKEKLISGMKGLDYGCGPEPVTATIMKEQGYCMVNYDPHFYPREFLIDERYDFITCTEVIEHFRTPRAELEKLISLLKPRGFLGIMTAVYDSNIDFSSWWYLRDSTHVSLYQEKTFSWIAEEFRLTMHVPEKNVCILQMR